MRSTYNPQSQLDAILPRLRRVSAHGRPRNGGHDVPRRDLGLEAGREGVEVGPAEIHHVAYGEDVGELGVLELQGWLDGDAARGQDRAWAELGDEFGGEALADAFDLSKH